MPRPFLMSPWATAHIKNWHCIVFSKKVLLSSDCKSSLMCNAFTNKKLLWKVGQKWLIVINHDQLSKISLVPVLAVWISRTHPARPPWTPALSSQTHSRSFHVAGSFLLYLQAERETVKTWNLNAAPASCWSVKLKNPTFTQSVNAPKINTFFDSCCFYFNIDKIKF